jgi:hypothetical protein
MLTSKRIAADIVKVVVLPKIYGGLTLAIAVLIQPIWIIQTLFDIYIK